ncbi:hypothetical protein EVAR_103066_1 [Eumeta japonica]|uniref:Uncharacterized protein n=1 Tax=Eumeta variegata TaxID=151549 RepID=A0A4C1WMX1_EUMVA|nr:hypothetical protein EVAR_103066_1 [Eumeta japonica]
MRGRRVSPRRSELKFGLVMSSRRESSAQIFANLHALSLARIEIRLTGNPMLILCVKFDRVGEVKPCKMLVLDQSVKLRTRRHSSTLSAFIGAPNLLRSARPRAARVFGAERRVAYTISECRRDAGFGFNDVTGLAILNVPLRAAGVDTYRVIEYLFT